jgi:hypothetical protein
MSGASIQSKPVSIIWRSATFERHGHLTTSFTEPVHRPTRKLAMHQTASAACRNNRRPRKEHRRASRRRQRIARIATATVLYSSIAATNPRLARLGPSSRASQQAPPNESSAAPAITGHDERRRCVERCAEQERDDKRR